MYNGKIRQEFNKTSRKTSRYMLQNKRIGCKPTTT